MRKALKLTLVLAILCTVSCRQSDPFVHTVNGQFVQQGKPLSYIGTNFWYGPILASEGRGGDPERLCRELDSLKSLGLTNLRTLVGGDGRDGVFSRVDPTLQTAPGVYNDTLLRGLDRYLVELGKRDMKTVLYLNNSWEWSGGYGQYLEWASGEKALIPLVDGYWPFMLQMRKFQTDTAAQHLFYNHVRAIVSRVNTISGKPYKEDSAIFAWQIGNEPRCFSDDPQIRDGFIGWLTESARIIKEIDPNHLLSTGNEGLMGCEADTTLLRRVNTIPGIDYMTVHIWPYNWGWAKAESLEADLPGALEKTDEYLDVHIRMGAELGLPVVVEEFGFPRDGFSSSIEAGTTCRDRYYSHLFSKVVSGDIQGLNFWGWSGEARPESDQWKPYDPYTGDPAQEAQGLNGVYNSDNTVELIRQLTKQHNQFK